MLKASFIAATSGFVAVPFSATLAVMAAFAALVTLIAHKRRETQVRAFIL